MINKIVGLIDEISEMFVSVENNGISYTIYIPGGLLEKIKQTKKIGDKIELFTIYYIENGVGGSSLTPKLIGFNSQVEREFFEKYTTVKGLGIKTALKSLVRSVKTIATAIEDGDVKTIKKLPGLGGRTAEKIIAELRGRMTKYAIVKEINLDKTQTSVNKEEKNEAILDEVKLVLSELGYSKAETKILLANALKIREDFNNTEEIIQEIFKQQKN